MSETTTTWVTASASGSNGGNCVQVRAHAGAVEVRDSKAHGSGPSLYLTAAEFAAWVEAAKNGEFDHLA